MPRSALNEISRGVFQLGHGPNSIIFTIRGNRLILSRQPQKLLTEGENAQKLVLSVDGGIEGVASGVIGDGGNITSDQLQQILDGLQDNVKKWIEDAVSHVGSGVFSWKTRTGAVEPLAGDYTADMVGALPASTPIPSRLSQMVNDVGYITSSGGNVTNITHVSQLINDSKFVTEDDLKDALEGELSVTIPTKVSDLQNDLQFVTAEQLNALGGVGGGGGGGILVETDPTVPKWAKEPNKPTYTAKEVGALPDTVKVPENVSDLTNDLNFTSVTKTSDILNDLGFTRCMTVTEAEYEAIPEDKKEADVLYLVLDKSIVPASKLSELYNDIGFVTKDEIPEVPVVKAWALAETKPRYTAAEVGALPESTIIPKPYAWALASQKPSYIPSEVHALPDDTFIPTRISELVNDRGYTQIIHLTQEEYDALGDDVQPDVYYAIYGSECNTIIPTNVSDLVNDLEFVRKDELTDVPNVPEWSMAAEKPKYTADEVGALPVTTIIPKPYHWALQPNKPNYLPSEVHALPDDTVIPDRVSQLINDENYGTFIHMDRASYDALGDNVLNDVLYIITATNSDDTSDPLGDPITALSQLENDIGYVRFEDLPEVPDVKDWALEATKPTYTAKEVGALSKDTIIPKPHLWAMQENKPTYSCDEVGALSDTVSIPSKLTDLLNDGDFASIVPISLEDYLKLSAEDKTDTFYAVFDKDDEINLAEVPTKLSELHNDAGFITLNDLPEGPSDWAMAPFKPTYTAAEVGALPVTTKIPIIHRWARQATKPIYTSLEVGALPNDTFIPTLVSDLMNDAGYAVIVPITKQAYDALGEDRDSGVFYFVINDNEDDGTPVSDTFVVRETEDGWRIKTYPNSESVLSCEKLITVSPEQWVPYGAGWIIGPECEDINGIELPVEISSKVSETSTILFQSRDIPLIPFGGNTDDKYLTHTNQHNYMVMSEPTEALTIRISVVVNAIVNKGV